MTANQILRAHSRVPLPHEGMVDGGTPYTTEEIAFIFRSELAHELGIPAEELPDLMPSY